MRVGKGGINVFLIKIYYLGEVKAPLEHTTSIGDRVDKVYVFCDEDCNPIYFPGHGYFFREVPSLFFHEYGLPEDMLSEIEATVGKVYTLVDRSNDRHFETAFAMPKIKTLIKLATLSLDPYDHKKAQQTIVKAFNKVLKKYTKRQEGSKSQTG
jgi:hypothetical protein